MNAAAAGQWAQYYANQDKQYRKRMESRQWLDYPHTVSIETFAKCNATCIFCPYPGLDRIGETMPTTTVHKIIDDLAAVGGRRPETLMFTRVNEPFLDKRMIGFMRRVAEKLPGCHCPQSTNGTPLTDKLIDLVADIGNVPWLKVSFNDHDPERYETTMKLPYAKTLAKLDHLHARKAKGGLPFKIIVGRVGDGSPHDADFIAWCKARFPAFEIRVTRPFDWMGEKAEVKTFDAPKTGCSQWFDLHFLANGREAYCCIDANGLPMGGDAAKTNVLDIYNRPSRRRMRESYISRESVPLCRACTY